MFNYMTFCWNVNNTKTIYCTYIDIVSLFLYFLLLVYIICCCHVCRMFFMYSVSQRASQMASVFLQCILCLLTDSNNLFHLYRQKLSAYKIWQTSFQTSHVKYCNNLQNIICSTLFNYVHRILCSTT